MREREYFENGERGNWDRDRDRDRDENRTFGMRESMEGGPWNQGYRSDEPYAERGREYGQQRLRDLCGSPEPSAGTSHFRGKGPKSFKRDSEKSEVPRIGGRSKSRKGRAA